MSCTVEPTPEERAANSAKFKELYQIAIAYEEMCENWRVFQQELCEFLTEFNGDLKTMSVMKGLNVKYPNLTTWMRQHVAADLERRKRKLMLEKIASKLFELDDTTLA